MNKRLRNAIIGALTGGGLVGGGAASIGMGGINALKLGLIGAIPGAALGAILGNPEPPKKDKDKDDKQLYFNYPPSLQSMYADYTR
tara:strand:- start:109 stop:366 length:258 start_codon:yes stop_codon:yes gene_type:complete